MKNNLKDWVKLQLVQNTKLRDNNELLYYKYLKFINYPIEIKTAKEFLKDMSNRKIPYLDSIARASRFVQENHPHLRGELWKKRKLKAVEISAEIIKIKNN